MVNHSVNARVSEMVNARVKGGHKPPSRIKYEESHPVISVRISNELRSELQELSKNTGKSFADFLKDGAGITKKQIEKSPPPECIFCNKRYPWGDYFVICKSCFDEMSGEELFDLLKAFFTS